MLQLNILFFYPVLRNGISVVWENVLQSARDNFFKNSPSVFPFLNIVSLLFCQCYALCRQELRVKPPAGKCAGIQESDKHICMLARIMWTDLQPDSLCVKAQLIVHVERCSALCKTPPNERTEAADLFTLRSRKGFSSGNVFYLLP